MQGRFDGEFVDDSRHQYVVPEEFVRNQPRLGPPTSFHQALGEISHQSWAVGLVGLKSFTTQELMDEVLRRTERGG